MKDCKSSLFFWIFIKTKIWRYCKVQT